MKEGVSEGKNVLIKQMVEVLYNTYVYQILMIHTSNIL